jgi:N6-adenosine-specific RNA methylase IME4
VICARNDIRVIYADPPWTFSTWSKRGEDRSPVQHYACMSLGDICGLPVRDVAAADCALFMWVVQPMLPQALTVIDAWGFTFKTVAFAWVKTKGAQRFLFQSPEDVRMGMGYHTRSGFEQCWLATRGKGYRRQVMDQPQVVFAPVREHSRKPDEIADAIVRLVGDVPRLEMFARTRRPGWEVFGNQTEKFATA